MNIRNTFTSIKSKISANTEQYKATPRALAVLAGATMAAGMLVPEVAMAAPWDSTASSVLALLQGGLTKTIAILGVTACGIAAVFGKLSWDWAIKIIIGIVLIFGAPALVTYIISATGQ